MAGAVLVGVGNGSAAEAGVEVGVGVPCERLGFGFSTPDDRMWYDVHTVLQVNTCTAGVDLIMRPEDTGEVDDNAVIQGAVTALTLE